MTKTNETSSLCPEGVSLFGRHPPHFSTAVYTNFNGLGAAAQERLGEDPKSGALFVFGNRRHNRIKLLYFDGTGVCGLAKRLERGTFHWPQRAGEPNAKLQLAPQALQLVLDGVDLKDGARGAQRRHPRAQIAFAKYEQVARRCV